MSAELGAKADTLAAAFSAVAMERPHAAALVLEGRRMTFADVESGARRLATGLAESIRPGDRVLFIAGNRPEHVTWLLAAARIGAVFTSVHPGRTTTEIRRVVLDAEPRIVATEHDLVESATQAVAGTSVLQVVNVDDRDQVLALGRPGPGPDRNVSSSDDCVIWYTSGTSGHPKWVVWMHAAFLHNALAINHAVGTGPADVCLRVSPMAHNGISSAVVGTMLRGASVHLLRRFDAAQVIETIRAHRATWTNFVPAAAQLLLDAAERDGVETLPSLRRVLVGAAPIPVSVVRRLTEPFPHREIVPGYGASEGYISVRRPGIPMRFDGSVDSPLPHTLVQIVDDDGNPLPPGRTGQIRFMTPGATRCYWRKPAETRSVRVTETWLDIGDVGHMGEAGMLWVAGRTGEVISCGGYNVHASEVEDALIGCPGVIGAAVVGRPHQLMGETVMAFVELAPGHGVDFEGIRRRCAAPLARYKWPSKIAVLPRVPRNAYGKLQKSLLPGLEDAEAFLDLVRLKAPETGSSREPQQ